MECPSCGCTKIMEHITSGIQQTVLWDGDWIVEENTHYDKTLKHSSYRCVGCGRDLTGV